MDLLFLASFGGIMTYVGYILLAVLILLVMITVHELGHYIAGKIFKFGIEEFAIGFGPKIFSKTKKNGEKFSIRALPIGGFCAFKGEDEEDTSPNAFNNKKPWQRIIVLVSGAFMNYLLALLLIVIMFSCYGQPALMTYKTAEIPNGITAENSFQDKDVILKLNGKNVYLITDAMNAVEGKKAGDKVGALVRRNGQEVEFMLVLRTDTNFKNIEDIKPLYNAIGAYFQTDANGEITQSGIYSTSVKLGLFRTIGRSFDYSFKLAGTVLSVLGELITGALGLSAVGGTVTTITMTASAIQIGGLRYLLNIASLIGVNLAVFNLLPIPALDGSRVVFTGIEWIRKKPVNRRVEGIIHAVGLVFLLIFAVVIDLQRCF